MDQICAGSNQIVVWLRQLDGLRAGGVGKLRGDPLAWLRYWRTPSGAEVDFIWTRARRAVGIDVKAATHWRREFGGPLRVLPLRKFLTELAAGNVLH